MGSCNPWWYRWFHSKILWLAVATTSNDPLVFGNVFFNSVRQYGVAPRLLRMDNWTENTSCKHLKSFFINDQDSCPNSVLIRNQRIGELVKVNEIQNDMVN